MATFDILKPNNQESVQAFSSFANRNNERKPFDVSKTKGFVDPAKVSQQPVNNRFIGPEKPIAVDTLDTPTSTVSQIQDTVQSAPFSQVAGSDTTRQVSRDAPVAPPAAEKKEPSLSEQLRNQFQDEFSEENKELRRDELRNIRESSRIEEKKAEVDRIENSMRLDRVNFEEDIEELKQQNRRGRSLGAINNDINQITEKYNRNLVRKSITADIASDQYEAADLKVRNYAAGVEAEQKRKTDYFTTMMAFTTNDMTDSEKIASQQAHDLNILKSKSDVENVKVTAEQAALNGQSESWVRGIEDGSIAIKDVPKELQTNVLSQMQSRGIVDQETKDKTKNDVALLGSMVALFNNPALEAATGPVGRFLPSLKTLTGETSDFSKDFENIKDNLTLGNLGLMSGVLSETDIKILSSAASSLSKAQTTKAFRGELTSLITDYTNRVLEKSFVDVDTKKQVLIDRILLNDPNKSDEDIAAEVDILIQDYIPEQEQSDSVAISDAIKEVESGGDYFAQGASGEFGAYQFMPNTWKQWAKEFLGDANAEPTPENQDIVANAKITQLVEQGKTAEEIALIWNGGTPKRKSGVNSFGVPFDSGAYADKVLRQLTA